MIEKLYFLYYISTAAGFQVHRGSQVEPINMENVKKLQHQIYAEEPPQGGDLVSQNLAKDPS